jgi:hypothetical protein
MRCIAAKKMSLLLRCTSLLQRLTPHALHGPRIFLDLAGVVFRPLDGPLRIIEAIWGKTILTAALKRNIVKTETIVLWVA